MSLGTRRTYGSGAESSRSISVPEGATVAFKQRASNELEWSYAVKGTVIQQGVDTVSSDGRSMTSVNWAPGKESEKIVQVCDKQ